MNIYIGSQITQYLFFIVKSNQYEKQTSYKTTKKIHCTYIHLCIHTFVIFKCMTAGSYNIIKTFILPFLYVFYFFLSLITITFVFF